MLETIFEVFVYVCIGAAYVIGLVCFPMLLIYWIARNIREFIRKIKS
ncbi:MAG: hypothetical protein HUK01_04725 [Bacteroidaceae bacterium]|nr:hypothetical protein [Bacteroidaceae bacterium]